MGADIVAVSVLDVLPLIYECALLEETPRNVSFETIESWQRGS